MRCKNLDNITIGEINIMPFSLGIDPDASGSVDVYFNHDDDDHWYSFVLNWRLWY